MRGPNSLSRFLLVALILFFVAGNSIWVLLDGRLPLFDEYEYYAFSINIHKTLIPFQPLRFLSVVTGSPGERPPVYPVFISVFLLMGGISYGAALLTNSLLGAAAIYLTYKIGVLLENIAVGLFAACLLVLFPYFFNGSHRLLSENCLIVFVALNILLLLGSREFRRRDFSVLYGLSLGIGMLVKQSFALFAITPLLLSIIPVFPSGKISRGNLFISLLLAFSVAAPYYFVHFQDFETLHRLNKVQNSLVSSADIISLTSLFWALTALEKSLGIIFFLLLIASFAFWIRNMKKDNYLVLGWLVGGFILTSLIVKNRDRHLAPLLPGAALFIALAWNKLRKPSSKRIIVAVCLFSGLFIYMRSNWAFAQRLVRLPAKAVELPWHGYYFEVLPGANSPLVADHDWKVETILNEITSDTNSRAAQVLVIPYLRPFNADQFHVRALSLSLPLKITRPSWRVFRLNFWALLKSDYVITKTGQVRLRYTEPDFRREMADFVERGESVWAKNNEIMGEWKLPDRSVARVYRRIRPATSEELRQVHDWAKSIDPRIQPDSDAWQPDRY